MRIAPQDYVISGLRSQYSLYVDLCEIADRRFAAEPCLATRIAAESARAAMAAADDMLRRAIADDRVVNAS